MSHRLNMHDPTGILATEPGVGITLCQGQTKPTDAQAGYAPGCIFIHIDGSGNTSLYVNLGSATSCNFDTVADYPIADAGGIITATTIEGALQENRTAIDAIEAAETKTQVTLGTGISGSANTVCEHVVEKIGNIAHTTIVLDLTDLASGGAANDIIGDDGGVANCHFGQILAAVHGTITSGKITCIETPATGDDDIDLYYGDLATGAENANIDTADSGSATQLSDHGNWAAGEWDVLIATPAANEYLYLSAVTGDADAAYTAGKFVIELWGVLA